MKKRLVGLLLSFMLIFTIPITANAAYASNFTDVKPGAWHYAAVDYAVKNNLFKGTSETTFSPDTEMNRGMFVTVLGRMAGVADVYGENKASPFCDITHSDYFYPYATWCNDAGIVSGVGNNRFAPSQSIAREDMAVILYRYAEKKWLDTSYSGTKYAAFTDTNMVSDYAVNALKWATSHDIIKGSNGKINPKGYATRAQVAQILLNFSSMANTGETPTPTPSPDPSPSPTPENPINSENYNPAYTRPTGHSQKDADGGYYDYDLANEIMDQINILRNSNGVNSLKYNPRIQEWASIRAKEHTGKTAHVRPDGSHWSTVGEGLHGENLLWGNDFSYYYKNHIKEYASEVISTWSGSESHNRGMLEPSFKLGAVSCYVQENHIYIAHLFSRQSLYFIDQLVD